MRAFHKNIHNYFISYVNPKNEKEEDLARFQWQQKISFNKITILPAKNIPNSLSYSM